MKHVFHLKLNSFFLIVSFEKNCQKRGSRFITGSKHLRPRAFICISEFGTRKEALTLVFEIFHQTQVCHTLLHGLPLLKFLVSHYLGGGGGGGGE